MRAIKETVAVTVLVEVEYENRTGARDAVLREAARHLTRTSGEVNWWSHGFSSDHGLRLVGRSAVASVRRTKMKITRNGKVRP